MANSQSVGKVNANVGRAERRTDEEAICPGCQAELPVVETGNGWCWRCGARYWAEMKAGELQVYGAELGGGTALETVGDETMADCKPGELLDYGNRDETDPDGGIHGICPLCDERLMIYISGRCRCEACGGALVVQHRRGRGRYEWLADDELFESVSDRVRTAYRDDHTEI